MLRNIRGFLLGVAIASLLVLLPAVQSSSAGDGAIAPALQEQLKAAAPDQLVTAIVKMRSAAPPPHSREGRAQMFSALRADASLSQAALLQYLEEPAVKSQRGVVRRFWIDNLVLVQAPRAVIETIARRSDVEKVFDNYTLTLPPRLPGDPEPNPSQSQPWDNIAHIGAKQVWSSYGLTGSGIRVGGLDTGVDINHPDIAGKMITHNPADPTYPGGWAEFDGNGNIIPGSVPHDSDQHGTHTTGTMIGGSASGFDIGVAPGASLMHGLVIPGGSGSFAQVVGGMEWIIDPDNNPATDDGAQVVNMSLGATGTFPEMVAPTDNMIAADVFPSFSIGNSGPGASTTGSPGNVPSAFGVGATSSADVIASFSSRGPVTWNTPPYAGTYTKPDISAPGVEIYSSVPGGDWQWQGPGFTWSGTSMAAPHVSGTVALMRQANPSLTVDEIKTILAQTSLDLGAAGMDNNYGWGRVNAFAAVSAALVGVGTLDGTVTSSGGGPVDNAMVLVVETGQRVFTDASGHYDLRLVAGDHAIEVSRFGYETATATVTIVADATTTQDFTLNQLPSGIVAGIVSDAQSAAGISAAISVKLAGQVVVTSATNPATGAYSITLPVGTYDLTFTPTFPYPTTTRPGIIVVEAMTTTVDVALMPAEILVVDDDTGDGYESYYQQAIAAAGRSYLTVGSPPTAADMAQFDAVVWLTGNDYSTTLTSTDQAEIAAFLDGGGRLFMSGQDIGYDIGTAPFYGGYLHAQYVQDDVGLAGVLGNPQSPVGSGFAFEIAGGSGANNQAYPSEINPVGGAMTAFFYDPALPAGSATGTGGVTRNGVVVGDGITDSGTAGLTFEGGYRLVYFAFGFEAIANDVDRTAVMDRVLDWLQGFPRIAHTPLGDTEDTTHPYNVRATITSDYFMLDPSSFAVVYSTGGSGMTVPMSPTGAPDEYAANIPAQAAETQVDYYISAADIEGHVSTDPVGAPGLSHSFSVGRDMEPAEISHLPLRDTNDLTGPYPVHATVTDNIGVEAVYLMYAKNGGMYHRVKMITPDPIMPEYEGAIPGPSLVGDQYDYYLLAMDESYSGNATRLPATGTYRFSIVEEFAWDFETDDGGYTETGDIWQWGAPGSGPGAAHSGANLWGTILGGTYPSSSNATLDIPAITIAADRPYAVLSFWHWYNMENEYDGGNVKVSTDGGTTFQVVTPARGYDGTARTSNAGIPGEPCFTNIKEYWQEDVFDLSAFAGQSVIIRFHFGSDGSVNRSGWYVDDVRLRSSDVDDVAPSISNVVVPASSFDTAGPYTVSADVRDLFSGVAGVSMFYRLGSGSYTEVPMTHGAGDSWSAAIPGQSNGTRVSLYLRASDVAGNVTSSPETAPADSYAFAILPSSDILAIVYSTGGATVNDYRAALEAHGHQADYWNQPTQGALTAEEMQLYDMIILDARSGLNTADQTSLAAFLNAGTQASKKRIFLLGRDLGFSSTTRGWISQYMRADYVQDNPNYFEITGESGDPIGMGETFVIAGSYPDEMQRSAANPGGVIVYRYTGPGSAAASYAEIQDEYAKAQKEWDGVTADAPISLDAAAGIRYNGPTYRSMYLAFNLEYMQDLSRRADIMDRVVRWTAAPDIVHTPLSDTENTSTPYVVTALVYSDNLDPSRVRLTYDVGAGPVVVTMLATGNPDEYSASIPPQGFGSEVNYYLSAANLDGSTSFDPAGAPAEQHAFNVISDNVAPVIAHTPPQYSADLAGPYTIHATVTDNVGVDPATVSLVYNKNGGSNQTVAMANTGGDGYAADIPGPSLVGDAYNYYIIARDVATVPNTGRSPASGTHTLNIVDFFVWDFEAGNGGFTATGQDWEWGAPTNGPGGANSGVNVWATRLTTNYSASSNSRLDSPPVVVPSGSTYAQLSLWMWYDTELNYDGMNVKISGDGGSNWSILTPDIGYNATATSGNAGIPGEPCFSGHGQKFWQKAIFDLTPYQGQAVMVRLHFGSDSSVQYPGFYVDDVRIEGAEDTEGPSFVARSIPLSTFDETGPYHVTATVADALSGVAQVNMHYSTDGGTSYTPVAMTATGSPDQYGADIPGQTSGTRIKVYFDATDMAANGATDPATAPAMTYEFGILPSGDYLVVVGGTAETSPLLFQEAFATLGRTCDIWDWDQSGVPGAAVLAAYDAVIIDESSYFDAAQIAALTAFLDTDDGTRQQVFMMGRDLSYGATARPFMEQYTGAAYVKDNPAWFQISSEPGDPIGADETFTISGSYPDELMFSAAWPGASAVYRYSGLGSASDRFDTAQEYREFYQKEGKDWDPKLWPFAPSGPDSLAGVRFVGPHHAAVYFAFNLYYVQEPARRAAVLGRALDWLASTTTLTVAAHGERLGAVETPGLPPRELSLDQNYPNPFNPTTQLRIGIPAKHSTPVSLKIYNVRGQLVKTVFTGVKPAGYHTFTWDGTDERGAPVATGVYFANFVANDARMTRKMVLLK